jgi:Flp pilus assembly protein TadD
MGKHTLVVLSLALLLVIALEPRHSVHGILMTAAEVSLLNGANPPAANDIKQNGGDNALVRALKAPFKAIGRLFGRGKKDDNKLHRLSEKDVTKFESTPVTRINDATSVPPSAAVEPDTNASGHLERGRTLLNEGNVNEAISELSRAVSMDPKLADAHNLLGVAYECKGLNDLAQKSFEAALKIDKKQPQILNNLGYLLYLNGDYKRAADRLKQAARLAPQDERILNNLALAQSRLGKFEDASRNFISAVGEVNGRLNLANRLELAGRSDEARKQYEEARLRAEAQQKADHSSQKITVVMEIKDGRVTYASVPDRRAGMGAYESAALRVARQRRYPADKNGQESVVVYVSPLPGN